MPTSILLVFIIFQEVTPLIYILVGNQQHNKQVTDLKNSVMKFSWFVFLLIKLQKSK